MNNVEKFFAGMQGEAEVERILATIPNIKYITDTILTYKGKTTQVDFIVIGRFGIICLEVKNILGTVEGNIDQINWLVKYNGRKMKLFNPIYQNAKHIRALSDNIKYDNPKPIENMIAFSDRSILDCKEPGVVYYAELEDLRGRRGRAFTDQEVMYWYKATLAIKEKNYHLSIKHDKQQSKYLR